MGTPGGQYYSSFSCSSKRILMLNIKAGTGHRKATRKYPVLDLEVYNIYVYIFIYAVLKFSVNIMVPKQKS